MIKVSRVWYADDVTTTSTLPAISVGGVTPVQVMDTLQMLTKLG